MGCIITAEELKLALDNAGCETKDGAYKVRGNITSFMGLGDEFCIGDDAEYFANGEAHNLVELLNNEHAGIKVHVL